MPYVDWIYNELDGQFTVKNDSMEAKHFRPRSLMLLGWNVNICLVMLYFDGCEEFWMAGQWSRSA